MSKEDVIKNILAIVFENSEFIKEDFENFNMFAKQMGFSEEKVKDIHDKYKNIYLSKQYEEKYTKLYTDAYSSLFSEQELEGLLAFYQSDCGKAYLRNGYILEDRLSFLENERAKEASLQVYNSIIQNTYYTKIN